MSGSMNWPKNWQDSVKATALATLAERTPTAARIAAAAAWTWNAHDLWLSRVKLPREQATPTQQGSVLRI